MEPRIELVWVNRIYTKDFITDFFQNMKNIVGGRLKSYEKMLDYAIQETWDEFKTKYPTAKRLRVDTEQMGEGGVMVTITGEVGANDLK